MKLKTRLKLAWLELALAGTFLVSGMGLKLALSPPRTPMGAVLDLLLPAFLFLPLCITAWRRLDKVKARIAEMGPEGAPSADFWTAPGAPGVLGVMIVLLALVAALAPPLLVH